MNEEYFYHLQLSDLRIFIEAAHTLSFTKTARTLFVGQPFVSKRIKALETELGVKLFDRSGRHLRLTKAGEEFNKRIGAAYQGIIDAVDAADLARYGVSEFLRVGVAQWDNLLFMRSLVDMKRANPDLHLELFSYSFKTLVTQLWDGVIDVALTNEYSALSYPEERFKRRVCGWIPVYVYMSRDNALARKCLIRFSDLRAQPLLVPSYETSPAYYEFLVRFSEQAGFEPNIVSRIGSLSAFPWHLALDEGVLMSSTMFTSVGPESLVTRVPLETMRTHMMALWREEADTSAIDKLFAYLQADPGHIGARQAGA